jgi:hypothetical protein
MQRGPVTLQDDIRIALALARRLSRPARGLFDLLALLDARLHRPTEIDGLTAEPGTPETLTRLLSPRGTSPGPPGRARAIGPEPPLRALSRPAAPKTAEKKSGGSHKDHAPPRPARQKAPSPGLPRAKSRRDHTSDLVEAAREHRKDVPLKPTNLRDIAEMRRALRRKSVAAQPSPIPAVSDALPDTPSASRREQSGTDALPATATRSPHALVALARRCLQAGLTLPLGEAPHPAEPNLPATDRADTASIGVERNLAAAFADLSAPGQASGRAAAVSVPEQATGQAASPYLPARDTPPRPETPERSTPQRHESGAGTKLSDAAWRNGVEPP